MLHLNRKLWPEDRAKKILEWIRQPAAKDFIDWLAAQAAIKTAEAGNALVEKDMGGDVQSTLAAEEARKFLGVHEVLTGVLYETIKLETAEISPKPLTKPGT